jgi:hypothetical protein
MKKSDLEAEVMEILAENKDIEIIQECNLKFMISYTRGGRRRRGRSHCQSQGCALNNHKEG